LKSFLSTLNSIAQDAFWVLCLALTGGQLTKHRSRRMYHV
jgi:hypothetical protein